MARHPFSSRSPEHHLSPALATSVSAAQPPPLDHAGPKRLLTFDDVAAILRTSRKAVYAMRARGQLPAVIKVGRRVLMREVDLLAWLAERVVSPTESRR